MVAALLFPLAVAFWIDLYGMGAMETIGRAPVLRWSLRTMISALIWVYTLPHPGNFSWSWGLACLLWALFAAMFALRRRWCSAAAVLFPPLVALWYLAVTVGGAD